jgi:hypothetical protein
MQNLKLAEHRLKQKNLDLVIAKNGRIVFENGFQGIRGLLRAMEKLGKESIGSSVADRIVGRAAAMLCVYSKAASVFAVTISEEGIKVLEDNKVFYRFENRVPNILNQEGTDICPLEKLVMAFTKPEEAYKKLKFFVDTQG